jgi:hypothetical protein
VSRVESQPVRQAPKTTAVEAEDYSRLVRIPIRQWTDQQLTGYREILFDVIRSESPPASQQKTLVQTIQIIDEERTRRNQESLIKGAMKVEKFEQFQKLSAFLSKDIKQNGFVASVALQVANDLLGKAHDIGVTIHSVQAARYKETPEVKLKNDATEAKYKQQQEKYYQEADKFLRFSIQNISSGRELLNARQNLEFLILNRMQKELRGVHGPDERIAKTKILDEVEKQIDQRAIELQLPKEQLKALDERKNYADYQRAILVGIPSLISEKGLPLALSLLGIEKLSQDSSKPKIVKAQDLFLKSDTRIRPQTFEKDRIATSPLSQKSIKDILQATNTISAERLQTAAEVLDTCARADLAAAQLGRDGYRERSAFLDREILSLIADSTRLRLRTGMEKVQSLSVDLNRSLGWYLRDSRDFQAVASFKKFVETAQKGEIEEVGLWSVAGAAAGAVTLAVVAGSNPIGWTALAAYVSTGMAVGNAVRVGVQLVNGRQQILNPGVTGYISSEETAVNAFGTAFDFLAAYGAVRASVNLVKFAPKLREAGKLMATLELTDEAATTLKTFCESQIGISLEGVSKSELKSELPQKLRQFFDSQADKLLQVGGVAADLSEMALMGITLGSGLYQVFLSDEVEKLPPDQKKAAREAFWSQMKKMGVLLASHSIVKMGVSKLQDNGLSSYLAPHELSPLPQINKVESLPEDVRQDLPKLVRNHQVETNGSAVIGAGAIDTLSSEGKFPIDLKRNPETNYRLDDPSWINNLSPIDAILTLSNLTGKSDIDLVGSSYNIPAVDALAARINNLSEGEIDILTNQILKLSPPERLDSIDQLSSLAYAQWIYTDNPPSKKIRQILTTIEKVESSKLDQYQARYGLQYTDPTSENGTIIDVNAAYYGTIAAQRPIVELSKTHSGGVADSDQLREWRKIVQEFQATQFQQKFQASQFDQISQDYVAVYNYNGIPQGVFSANERNPRFIAYSDIANNSKINPLGSVNSVGGLLLQRLHHPMLVKQAEADLNITFKSISLRSQVQLLRFLAENNTESFLRLQKVLLRHKASEYSILESFLAAGENKEFGNTILDLAEKLQPDDAAKVFKRYSQIVELVDGNESKIFARAGIIEPSPKQIQDTRRSLIRKANSLLESSLHEINEGGDPKSQTAKLTHLLARAEDEVLVTSALYKSIPPAQRADLTLSISAASELNSDEITLMQKIGRENSDSTYKSDPVYREWTKQSLGGAFTDPSCTYYVLRVKGQIVAFMRSTPTDDPGTLYIGSFNADKFHMDSGLGFDFFSQVVGKLGATHNLEAVAHRDVPALHRYLEEYGFKIVGFSNVGETPTSVYKIRREVGPLTVSK